ncbi:pyridoxal phosphate-dependent decarboxylase family protein [Natronogracilivirga saccharolytica]|uniref:Aspartate aminotransferase family protein n=1 Tax=Natronogracilivirga saccharolytica TaxID=2812953 RepID=A0A8J7RKH9_9BACT|nr:aminotransferase class I/II-fold pyridoxal phosphate-dependent enzyme [Natronogracilivirga saccharolytica]MBP3191329.1 aspartate aminotransferase family protein [Natronogracilivirga saccharolytica]
MIPDRYLKRLPDLLAGLQSRLDDNRSPTTHTGAVPDVSEQQLQKSANELLERLSRHYPFHQPGYAGQMLKPPHPAAWLAYTLAMTINPNNHALDGGPEASYMEKEVIRKLVSFAGFPDKSIGHLTSSGTIANLEALWVARELHPDRPVAISSRAHYTHRRMAQLLRLPVIEIPDDEDGMPDLSKLNGPGAGSKNLPGTIVVTAGTTGLGIVEPLHRMTAWARQNDVRIHVDAAYGGFFHAIRNSGSIDPEPWDTLSQADSLVIDPHKHGLQPYGCGSVLFRDPEVGRFYKHDSPYTYFTTDDLHLGEISIECSRAGAAAVALWFTLELLPLNADGLGRILSACRNAALELYEALQESSLYRPVLKPDLDIVAFVPVENGGTYRSVSRQTDRILKRGMSAPQDERLHLSTLQLDKQQAERFLPGLEPDQDYIRVLRSVLMKPEHLGFIPEMMTRLERLAE